MDIKELETKLAEAEGKIIELSEASAEYDDKFSELEQEFEEDDTLFERLEELEAEYSELEGRLKIIEKTPLSPVTGTSGETTDLGEYKPLDSLQRDSEGITRRVF